MKKALFFAATSLFFASCSNNQETTDSANQVTIDSMSQVLAREHIIDSMNAVNGENIAAPGETTVHVVQSNGTSSNERSRSTGRATQSNNQTPAGAAPVAVASQGAGNTVTGPTAAEIEAKRKADNRKKAKSAATGALIGAGAGAAAGAVSGKNDHFKKENAVIGAGAGAVLGAGAGLLLQNRKLKKEREEEEAAKD